MKGSRLALLTAVTAASVGLTVLFASHLMVVNAPRPNPAVIIDGQPIPNLIAISYSINHTGETDPRLAFCIVGEITLEGENRDLVENFQYNLAIPNQMIIVYSIGLEFSEPIEEQGLLRTIICDSCYCTKISGKIEGQSALTTITFQGTRVHFELEG
jgi:hypothetical protein